MERFEDEKFISDDDWNARSFCIAKMSIGPDKSDELIQSLSKATDGDPRIFNTIAENIDSFEKHPKLMYGTAILASTSTNKNDDMFIPFETWKARKTPVNTPYNENHVKADILGHIFNSYVLDADANLVDDNSEDIPSYFDIAVDFVIYEHIFPNRAQDIASKASTNETFVSMECMFGDFDYGLLNSDGSTDKIISRNKDTAFLTKKLRIYQGDGRYDGKKIVRVLKDMAFTGMANVDSPANKKSEYKKIDDFVAANCNSINDSTLCQKFIYLTEGNIMKVENLEQAEKLIADLSKKVTDLEKEKNDSVANQKIGELEKERTDLQEQLKTVNTKLEVATSELGTSANKVKELETTLSAIKEDLTKKTEALDKINAETKAKERFTKLEQLGHKVQDENRRKDIESMTDQSFESVLAFITPLSENKQDASKLDDNAKAAAEAQKKIDEAKENKEQGNLEDAKVDETKASDRVKQNAAKFAEALKKSRDKKDNKK